ncbi:hypothetical protein BVX97_00485 [bacterium E08(2017)]|nr:hypothetical protein BVX97_00485 [bacterium E08(2017)]
MNNIYELASDDKRKKPWQHVTSAQVREAIKGTLLESVVEVLESVSNPKLPLEITLPKALALAGAALSQPVKDYDKSDMSRQGVDWLKVRINTAGGQACNIWSLIIGETASGKDMGRIVPKISSTRNLSLGSSGSAEGLADALSDNGGGLLCISELRPFLDKRCWQHKATSFLTDAFSSGSFKVNLSKRTSEARQSNFAFPSILANVQPIILAEYGDICSVEDGFLLRYLISVVPASTSLIRPVTEEICCSKAEDAIDVFMDTNGLVLVPPNYLADLYSTLVSGDAEALPYSRRLINEYGPRIATILSVEKEVSPPIIDASTWKKTELILLWFYTMAEQVLLEFEIDVRQRQRERKLARALKYIQKHSPCAKSDFSHHQVRLGDSTERDRLLNELEERGVIKLFRDNGKTILAISGGPKVDCPF